MDTAASDLQVETEMLVELRRELIRRLEACERGLAAAYGRAARRWPEMNMGARLHHRHAADLQSKLATLGGAPDEQVDDLWLGGPAHGLEELRLAEAEALSTLHDSLCDYGPALLPVIRRMIAEHERALADVERLLDAIRRAS